jgi:hypothetical protein
MACNDDVRVSLTGQLPGAAAVACSVLVCLHRRARGSTDRRTAPTLQRVESAIAQRTIAPFDSYRGKIRGLRSAFAE